MSTTPRIRPGRVVAVFTPADLRAVVQAAAGHEVPVALATVTDIASKRVNQ